jgi:Protein of unknown function (DUF3370)
MTSIKFQCKDLFMFPLIASFWIAQTPVIPGPQEILRSQEIRVLPGSLDNVPVFNSNSPELVLKEGILLSTFPPNGKQFEAAHLDRSFSGRFDIFAHHIAKGTPEDLRTLYLGIVAHNPSDVAVTIDILQGASHLSQPDAPFVEMGPFLDNQSGSVYAGPGSRVGSEVLRGFRQSVFPAKITIEPKGYALILNQDIPVSTLTPPINGRSALIRLRSDGPVYLASLGKFAPLDEQGKERSPTLDEWKTLLQTGNLSSPRDRVPTPISQTKGNLIYGRVAGWRSALDGNLWPPIPMLKRWRFLRRVGRFPMELVCSIVGSWEQAKTKRLRWKNAILIRPMKPMETMALNIM